MMRWLGALLLSLWLACGAQATLSLNSSATALQSSSQTVVVTLPTVTNGDLVVVDVECNSGPVTGITATGLAFSKHASIGTTSSDERWTAVASASASNLAITVTQTAGGNFISAIAYSISGANTSTPFDTGGPITTASGDPISITTHNANTMVLGYWRINVSNSTAGSGFTLIQSATSSFQISEYQIESSTGTFSVTLGTAAGSSSQSIIDAVVAAGGGGGPTCPLTRTLMGVGC